MGMDPLHRITHWMRFFCAFLAVFSLRCSSLAEILIPSQPDTSHSEIREKAFTPWGTPDELGVNWKKLSNIPIYKEMKEGDLGRDLYVPNPGIGHWALGGLDEKTLWRVHNEKLKIGDELVSASVYKDANGAVTYWALWAPENKSYLLKEKMREFGITPARVEFTTLEKLKKLSSDLAPYTAVAVFGILILSIILLLATIVLFLTVRKCRSVASSPQ